MFLNRKKDIIYSKTLRLDPVFQLANTTMVLTKALFGCKITFFEHQLRKERVIQLQKWTSSASSKWSSLLFPSFQNWTPRKPLKWNPTSPPEPVPFPKKRWIVSNKVSLSSVCLNKRGPTLNRSFCIVRHQPQRCHRPPAICRDP